MLPTLKLKKDDLMSNGFINAYSQDDTRELSYQNCIHLLFKPLDFDSFRKFLYTQYDTHKSIVDDYGIEGFHTIVYELDEKFSEDFELVRNGKYSQTSDEFQNLFPRLVTIDKRGFKHEELSLQYRIFNRTEDLIKYWEDKLEIRFDLNDENLEVWHGFIIEKETITEELLKQLENIEI